MTFQKQYDIAYMKSYLSEKNKKGSNVSATTAVDNTITDLIEIANTLIFDCMFLLCHVHVSE